MAMDGSCRHSGNVNQLHGLLGYYIRYIHEFSKRARILLDSLKPEFRKKADQKEQKTEEIEGSTSHQMI